MENSQEASSSIINNRIKNLLDSIGKCKIDFFSEKEECKKVKELNIKLETELLEARESEKSHRYHLLASREMIGNLQETVSQLIYLKRDVKKLKDELLSRDAIITALEKEKNTIIQRHDENIMEMRNDIEYITSETEKKLQQKQHECDTQVAQFTCVIEELKKQIKDLEMESRNKVNVVVLEYEEKLQRGAAQVAQLQEQLAHQAARSDANIDAYKRRVEELEEKLKQSSFKEYLTRSNYSSIYENQVERPYSANRDPYPGAVSLNPVLEVAKPMLPATISQHKALNPTRLQVITPNLAKTPDKKGSFNITKKRKLYNPKDF